MDRLRRASTPRRPESFMDASSTRRESNVAGAAFPAPRYPIPESSESNPSDERYIFNAIRASTSIDEARSREAIPRISAFEQRLAANLAMFVPTDYSQGPSSTDSPYEGIQTHRPMIYWRSQMLSDPYPHHAVQSVSNEIRQLDPLAHRKAVSDGSRPAARKPGNNLGPAVAPAQPRYPPPARAPTPPGLPSFGSPEAVRTSAQFLTRRRGVDGQRTHSYGDTLRQFFGLSPSSPASPQHPRPSNVHSVVGIGRAEDGTVVQGRFPYRQSGHGMNLAGELHDHPFHQRNLPAANGGTEGVPEDRDAKDIQTPTPAPSPAWGRRDERTARHHFLAASAVSPAIPEPATIANRCKSGFASPFRLPRRLSRLNEVRSAAPTANPVVSLTQGVEVSSNQPTGPSSSNAQPHSIPTTITTIAIPESIDSETPAPLNVGASIAAQFYLCCCMAICPGHDTHDEHEHELELEHQSLEQISSRDTYATARSHLSRGSRNGPEQHSGRQGLQVPPWILGAYQRVFPAWLGRGL
ncbi:hypothetical protein N7474_006843 [Penicillium riverlandense]|uniref:uncharacterized protein n=1 Tax=Penicillium riverlandense TaxID=1903569 RepID=UPI0025471206|nr:uncharacterized protein N7474_006843 [Penicillium riverlandense]KAJ5815066.1 hypothetical protein N7474_006843 [Penicillium riverlandense]